ncbi:3-dehydroquinate synthase [Ruminococcus flavefaciens]|uniref:3-dehydroquinate synthase n=1 Tax=Ruminococcus flavefaciens TaxID=1265 RepID=UPI0015666118|nr:3-dehydroquinate synthase [Ruminococcus flavefaciens]
MKKISVKTSHPYEVLIQRGGLAHCGEYISEVTKSRKAAIITDDIVEKLHLQTALDSMKAAGFECSVFVFPNGEQSKCLENLGKIYDFLCESNITRSEIIIALGGGVVGDITGFAAASYLRGVEFVQIPTTLLAQVDSSVGGKTAIDIAGGKNLVGAFKQPALVICDSDILKTLKPETLAEGMGECIKYGMIRDEKLFELMESKDLDTVDDIMDEMVYACIDIKRIVVEHDEFDRGERMVLNFGHTLGHALEGWYNYKGIAHGEAVAAGMCMITDRLAPQLSDRLRKVCEAYRLPTGSNIPMSELLPFCSKDKKNEAKDINYIICNEIGKGEIVKVPFTEFCRLMEG